MKRKIAVAVLAAAVGMMAPARACAMEEEAVKELADRIGSEYGLCPEMLQAVAWQESSYREDARCDGCAGLMQVSERWHSERMERLGVKSLYDPEGNMRVAADYLAELAEKYEDIGMVLMVYNGDSRAQEYQLTGELSGYAQAVLEKSWQLEQAHGK